MARLLLASSGIPGLASLLDARGRRAVLVPTAANPLGEPAIADEVECELAAAGLDVERLDLDHATPPQVRAVAEADVIAVSGGNPFHLLAAAHRTGFEHAAREALATGSVYVGYSAGAILAGPTLEPLLCTSPLRPRPDWISVGCACPRCSSSPTTTARGGLSATPRHRRHSQDASGSSRSATASSSSKTARGSPCCAADHQCTRDVAQRSTSRAIKPHRFCLGAAKGCVPFPRT